MDRRLYAVQEERQKRLQLLRGQIRVLDKVLKQQSVTGENAASWSRASSSSQEQEPRSSQSPAAAPRPQTPRRPARSTTTPALSSATSSQREAIDPLSLADSLFGANEIQQALQAYQGLPQQKLSAENRQWVRYQIAACHRRLGSLGVAEQELRELASTTTDDRVAAQARWWLDTLDKRKRLENSLKGVDEALNSAIETVGKGVP